MSGRSRVETVDPGRALAQARTVQLVEQHRQAFDRLAEAGIVSEASAEHVATGSHTAGDGRMAGDGHVAEGPHVAGAGHEAGEGREASRTTAPATIAAESRPHLTTIRAVAAGLGDHPVIGPVVRAAAAQAERLVQQGARDDDARLEAIEEGLRAPAERAAQDAAVVNALLDEQKAGEIKVTGVTAGSNGSSRIVVAIVDKTVSGHLAVDLAPTAADGLRDITVHTAESGIHQKHGCDVEDQVADGVGGRSALAMEGWQAPPRPARRTRAKSKSKAKPKARGADR